jgi:hypothetical protein
MHPVPLTAGVAVVLFKNESRRLHLLAQQRPIFVVFFNSGSIPIFIRFVSTEIHLKKNIPRRLFMVSVLCNSKMILKKKLENELQADYHHSTVCKRLLENKVAL